MIEKLKTNQCNFCGAEMKPDKYDFYRCPECESEFWIKPFEKSVDAQAKDAMSSYISRAEVRGATAPGGSKSGSSNRKQLMKKKTLNQLNNELGKC
ncbi:MAG: hypothetical protein H6Q73_909 [Firmicutes bacterium]|nr:hypothetical protein [Bacillota bacterium]